MPSRSVRPPRGESDRIDGSGQAGSGRPPDGPERGSTSSPSGDTLHITDPDHLHPTVFSDRARRARMQASSLARDFGARLVVMHIVEATHVAEELGDSVTRSPDSPYLGANTVENAVSSCCVRSSDLHPRQGEREKKFPEPRRVAALSTGMTGATRLAATLPILTQLDKVGLCSAPQ
jgi:hypothetical protein